VKKAEREVQEVVENLSSINVPTLPTNNLDTINSDSSLRGLQLTSRGGALRTSTWGDETVKIGPTKTPNFLGPNEMPSFNEDENSLPVIEEEKEHQDFIMKNKVSDNIFEFNP
jgi:hypothetical protein